MTDRSLRNSVTVESPYGLRSFALRQADILASPASILVVPTHASHGFPGGLTGLVLEAARDRHGIDFDDHEPLVMGRWGMGTYRVRSTGSFAGSEVLLVRILGGGQAAHMGLDHREVLGEALWTLFGSLSALELRSARLASAAMPLLAGTRGYPVRDLLRLILTHSLAWLRVSRTMASLDLHLVEDEAVREWSETMDDVLGRHTVDAAKNRIVEALRQELLHDLGHPVFPGLPEGWEPIVEGLRDHLGRDRIRLEGIAADARRLVEAIARALIAELGLSPANPELAGLTAALRGSRRIAPWILAHFDCLRHLGNESVHAENAGYHPARLQEDDLVAVLASLHRVVEFAKAPRPAAPAAAFALQEEGLAAEAAE